MGIIEVTLKWLSNDLISREDLDDKLTQGSCQNGYGMLYFWIHNEKRIAYIGETGRLDKGRLVEHIRLAKDGQYTAVDCEDGDLLDFYACHTKYYNCKKCRDHKQCPSKSGECQYFKPSKGYENPRMNSIYRERLRYIYAVLSEIRIDNNKSVSDAEQKHVRKEVEGILIKQMLHCVKQFPKREGQNFCHYGYFWGPVSRYPRQDYEYVIHMEESQRPPEVLGKELRWEAPSWIFCARKISFLRALRSIP